MFDTIEKGRKVSKSEFKRVVPELRLELVSLQHKLRERADFPVIVLVAGLNCAGRSETVNLLNEWMDPRFLITEAYWAPSPEERERPPFWRYWRDLPPKGRIAVFMHAWYLTAMVERFDKRMSRKDLNRHLDRASYFEQVLADDGALLIKFWLHLGRGKQKKRIKKLSKDPLQQWRVQATDRELVRHYDRYLAIAEAAVERTSSPAAPWIVVDGEDPRHRSLVVGRTIRDAVNRRLEEGPAEPDAAVKKTETDDGTDLVVSSLLPSLKRSVLDTLDMTQTVSKPDYERRLSMLQGRIRGLAHKARKRKLPVVLVFEGWDAAGKGGAVRRLTAAMDASDYRVIPIAAPNDEERARHYLWRFWRQLRRGGRMTIFDRSWYGRVLVERVEGFATERQWRRAYGEISDFEMQLTDFGVVLVKFWLHITSDEQLRRFELRESTPYKRWKLTDEDWRNREKWQLYEQAVEEMIARTSTDNARWVVVEANCKRFARLKVLTTVADALDAGLDQWGDRGERG
jgi:polyphosphate:AMP phosphotransferase